MVEKCARTGCRKLTFNLNSLSRLQLSLNGPPCRWYRRQVAYTCTPNTGHRGNTSRLPPRSLSRYRQEKLPVSYILEGGERFSVHASPSIVCVSHRGSLFQKLTVGPFCRRISRRLHATCMLPDNIAMRKNHDERYRG